MLVIGPLLTIVAVLLISRSVLRALPETINLPLVEGCSLQLEACAASLPVGGRMVFEISPKHPGATDPLHLSIGFEEIEPRTVSIGFEDVAMDMGNLGFLKYPLSRQETNDGSIIFAGKGGVFACSAGLMEWFVWVDLDIDGVVYKLPFRFATTGTGG